MTEPTSREPGGTFGTSSQEEPRGLLEATPAQERSPFTVIGASDAAVCVDGVCSVPPQPIGGTERRGHEA